MESRPPVAVRTAPVKVLQQQPRLRALSLAPGAEASSPLADAIRAYCEAPPKKDGRRQTLGYEDRARPTET